MTLLNWLFLADGVFWGWGACAFIQWALNTRPWRAGAASKSEPKTVAGRGRWEIIDTRDGEPYGDQRVISTHRTRERAEKKRDRFEDRLYPNPRYKLIVREKDA